MRPFGWKKWVILYNKFNKSKRRSIERWGLTYLHSKYSLDQLALLAAKALGKSGKHCEVSVESIWIDGTPQADAKAKSGSSIKCELADLLFILEEKDPTNTIVREMGLLLQGKATPKYNRLTSGSSTKKERQLLEGMDRAQPIALYRGTSSVASSLIGTYRLGGIPQGLSDCSRYLLMPKSAAWKSPYLFIRTPFQIGWPKSRTSPYLQSPKSIVETIQNMILSASIGKRITNPKACEWSRMVNDLRGDYIGAQMSGYGGQPRIRNSDVFLCFGSNSYTPHPFVSRMPPIDPPTENRNNENLEKNNPPSISIVKISIRHLDFHQSDREI